VLAQACDRFIEDYAPLVRHNRPSLLDRISPSALKIGALPLAIAGAGLDFEVWYQQVLHHVNLVNPEVALPSILGIAGAAFWHGDRQRRAAVAKRQQDMRLLCKQMFACNQHYSLSFNSASRPGAESLETRARRSEDLLATGDGEWREADGILQEYLSDKHYKHLAHAVRVIRGTLRMWVGRHTGTYPLGAAPGPDASEELKEIAYCFSEAMAELRGVGQSLCPSALDWL
jgi:hypothetical protein